MFHGPNGVLQLTLALVGAVLVAVGMAIGGYALGSFFLMIPHTAQRGVAMSARALLREVWTAAWTQPLLPLFYVVGHRMDGLVRRSGDVPNAMNGAATPVVFVHGYMQNRVDFVGLARALASRGIVPLFGFNYPWFTTIASNAERLDRFVARVCDETGARAVDLVCHSMGGLVAMEMMRDEARRERLRVRRCVTIASPHAGIAWKGPLVGVGASSLRRGSKLLEMHAGHRITVPCLSIYSAHDNVVHPKETAQLATRGGRDIEVAHVAHLAILFSPEVADRVAEFLVEPDPV